MTVPGEIPIDDYLRIIGYEPKMPPARRWRAAIAMLCVAATGVAAGRFIAWPGRDTLSITLPEALQKLNEPGIDSTTRQQATTAVQRQVELAIQELTLQAKNDEVGDKACISLKIIARSSIQAVRSLTGDPARRNRAVSTLEALRDELK